MKRVFFLGYPVDSLTMQEALHWITASVDSSKSKIIAVTNANKLWQAAGNTRMSEFLRQADLIIPEYAVVWGAKRLGISLHHIGGIMLLKAFLPFAKERGIRPYFLGAKPDVVEKMIENIKSNHPRMDIAGYHHGYLTNNNIKKWVIKDLKVSKPDILFIAMGSPKQEYLIDELKKELIIPVLMGVEGSFDVISGEKQDAPSWTRSTGLEWIYRILQEPLQKAYWKRYIITNTWFIYQVVKHMSHKSKNVIVHPHPNPPPSRGRELIRVTDTYSPSTGGRG